MPIYKSDTPTKDGRLYYFTVSYTDNNGKYTQYKSKKYLTKKECQKAEALFLANVGEYKSGSAATFKDVGLEMLAAEQLQLKAKSYRSLETKVNHVINLIGSLRIDKLTTQQYQKFIADVRSLGFSVEYLNDILATAKRIVRYAAKMHNINSAVPYQFPNIKDVDRKPKTFNIYTLEQYKTFSSVIDDPMMKALFDTLFYCGLRKGEACALTWADFKPSTRQIDINKSVNTSDKVKVATTPKTLSSNRTLPISQELCNEYLALKEYYSRADGFNDNWFIFGGYVAIPNNTLQVRKKKYYQLAKAIDPTLQEIRIHDFRHSCASFLINEIKAPITSVSRYLGHENPQITLSVYSHFYEKDLSSIADEIEKRLGKN